MTLDLDAIDRSMRFLPSDGYTISCGTVTLDPPRARVLLVWNRRLQIYQLPKGRKNIGEDMLSAAVRETLEETGVRVSPSRLRIATRATPSSSSSSSSASLLLSCAHHRAAVMLTPPPWSASATASVPFSPGAATGPMVTGADDDDKDEEEDEVENEDEREALAILKRGGKSKSNPEVTDDRASTEFVAACALPDSQSTHPAEKTVFFFAATADSTRPPEKGLLEEWEKLETAWTPLALAADRLRFRAEAEVVRKAVRDMRRAGVDVPLEGEGA